MEFSIIVPVYNEAGNVTSLLREIARVMAAHAPYEVLCVDDGSTDGSADELAALQAGNPRLRVLHHPRRCGQSSALLTGVRAARASWVITLDGDGQNDPADIPRLIGRLGRETANGDALMLVGHRRLRRDNWIRRVSSRVANAVRSRLLRDATPDSGCGLKLFPRALFLSLPAFDHMHRFLPALMQRQGARVVSLPVKHRARTCGVSKYGVRNRLWVGLVDIAGVMWLQRRRLGASQHGDHRWTRLFDALGVFWLQRRPCSAVVNEESANV
jgi:dolichol-phosphate mannosyltransferase